LSPTLRLAKMERLEFGAGQKSRHPLINT